MYKLSLVFKTNAILLLLVCNTLNSDNFDNYELYDYQYTGARYYTYHKYKGVSLIVSLMNNTVIYCMGFMVSDVKVEKNEVHPYQYVLTSAGCVNQDNFNNVRVLIRGSPYEIHNEKWIRNAKIISYPNYDNTLHNGDIVLIRMNSIYIGLSYPLSNKTPLDIVSEPFLRWNCYIVMWSDPIEYKPARLKNVSSVAVQQLQALHYSTDPERCPTQSYGKQSVNEKQKWYMFLCSDYSYPTRNPVTNPGALVIFEGKVVGLYSYSYTLPIENSTILKNPSANLSVQRELKVKIAYIHRYTVLHWYKPWIESSIRTDKRREDRIPQTTIKDNLTEHQQSPPSPPPPPPPPPQPPPPPDYYFDGYDAYDGLSVGTNPCNDYRAAARRVVGRFRLPLVLLLLLLYGVLSRYVECVHLFDDSGIFK